MTHVLFHISDIHVGPPFDEERARLIIAEANRLKPTLTVISGDLVQRADYPEQWLAARGFLEQLPLPRLTVPGNHDVPAYNPFARFFWPNRSYRRYISPELNPVFEAERLVVLGINSTRSFTIDGGKVREKDLAWIESTLARYPRSYCKVVVMHHHIAMPPGEERQQVPNAEEVRQALDRAGVELVLCGHTHASYIGNTLEFDPTLSAGTVIVQAGTATSRRGRRWYRGKNAFFIIEIEERRIIITEHLYLQDAGGFVPVSQHIYPLRSAGVYTLTADQQVGTVAEEQQEFNVQSSTFQVPSTEKA